MPIDLGTNLNWNPVHTWVENARPRTDPDFPGRIPDSIKFTSESRIIVIPSHNTPPKPWWLTAGRVVCEANFPFDTVMYPEGKLVIHQQQLLLNRANLIDLPEYTFPYSFFDNRYKWTFHWNKWLSGINAAILEYEY